MALSPSRRDTIGPPPRDISDLGAQVRHHQSWQRSVDPGILDGRFGTPRPVPHGPSQIVGGDAGGDTGDDNEILFENADRTTASTAGTVTLVLTYEPIEGSLHIRWNGLDQPPAEWTLDGQTVTFVNSHIHVGDVLTAAYAYYPTEDSAPEAATASLRGTNSASGSNGPALTGLALPAGTVLGDLIVVSAPGSVTITDSRLSSVGNGMWIGWATNLTDLAATDPGGFGSHWSIACMTLITNAVGWTASVLTQYLGLSDGQTFTVPVVSEVAASVCGILNGHAVVAGRCLTPLGYTAGVGSDSSLVQTRVDFWTSGSLNSSPTGPATFSGGSGDAYVAVVGLIGPS